MGNVRSEMFKADDSKVRSMFVVGMKRFVAVYSVHV